MEDRLGGDEHLLTGYFEQHPMGEAFAEVDCTVTENRVRRPDLSVFLQERLRQIDFDKIPAPFTPDIAIEVLSPSGGAMEARGRVLECLFITTVESVRLAQPMF